MPTESPEARSSEGVDATENRRVKGEMDISTDAMKNPRGSFTEGCGAIAAQLAQLAQPSLLLLSEQSADGRLNAFLLARLVQRILTAVGAAPVS